MLTAEAEKRVREIAREAAEKAVLDNRVSVGKQIDLSGDVAALDAMVEDLQREVEGLVHTNGTLTNRVSDLEFEVSNLQKEVDNLKSDVSSVLK